MSDQGPPADNPFKSPPAASGQPGFNRPGGVTVMQGANYVRQINVVAVLLIIHGALLILGGAAGIGFGLLFANSPQLFSGQMPVEVNFDEFEDEAGEAEIDAESIVEEALEDDSLDFAQDGDEGGGSDGDDVDDVDGEMDDGEEGSDEEDAGPSEAELAVAKYVAWMYGGIGVVVFLIGVLQVYAGIRNLSFKGRTVGIVALSLGILTAFTCWCAPTSLGLAIYGFIVYLSPAVTHAFQLRKEGVSKDNILARFPA